MNKLIFNKWIGYLSPKLVGKKIDSPFKIEKKETRYQGKVRAMKRKVFLKNQRDFCFKCLYISSEILDSMVAIKTQCDKITDETIWLTDITKSYKPEDFRQVQRGAYLACRNELCIEWCNKIIESIKVNLNKVGKGWYNMHETNTETYEFSKLKKFLTVVRFMMQEAIQKLARTSVTKFETQMSLMVPQKVIVKSINEVEVIQNTVLQPDHPLFFLEVVTRSEDKEVRRGGEKVTEKE